jgi:filamentous hemagglutinin family protein
VIQSPSCFFSSLICFTLASAMCSALPSIPEIYSGTAEVEHIDSHTMHIKPSDQAILRYQDFSIGEKERVRFIQNSSKSCVLNRITGENPSQILGSLESNGKVFLVNPNGIYFGPDSIVNVGSLIASTLDMAEEDFLNETYSFHLSSTKNASIINQGLIHSAEGSIVLLAPQIQNLGHIKAQSGSVVPGFYRRWAHSVFRRRKCKRGVDRAYGKY